MRPDRLGAAVFPARPATTSALSAGGWDSPPVWGALVRASLLTVGLMLALAHGLRLTSLMWILVLAVAALGPGLVRRRAQRDSRDASGEVLALVGESVLAALAVLFTGGAASPLLPYLIAPALAAGFCDGASVRLPIKLLVPTAALATLLAGRSLVALPVVPGGYVPAVSLWVLLATGAGLISAWVERLLRRDHASEKVTYATAYRLLAQLRPVARKLSTGLGIAPLGEDLLRQLGKVTGAEAAAVFTVTEGGQLSPLAFTHAELVARERDVTGTGPCAVAWRRRRLVLRKSASRVTLALPLQMGPQGIGVVRLELSHEPEQSQIQAVAGILAEGGLRLGSAFLFDEVRELATAEERRRIAREIHDGIAQELASLGYRIDDLASRDRSAAPGYPPISPLLELRADLNRIVDDLRLSIFELRSEVERHGGLGAALSDYVRTVGSDSAFTVHLLLDETPARLPADIEAELLRIAQEAITNARKHAAATNLWVTCRVTPPAALLIIEDDGTGLENPTRGGFGIEIMRERAARLGARLIIGRRSPAGTRVEVRLGMPAAAVPSGGTASKLVARGRG